MRVALDAMAGPAPPEAIVASALQTLRANKDLRLTILGVPEVPRSLLSDLGKARDRVQTFPASQFIGPHEDAAEALRFRPDTSIGRAWQLLAEKKVDALVTLGPVSAAVAAGMRLRRLIARVRQPGLAAFLPTQSGSCLLIDAGAHDEATPANLYQYGVMGALLRRSLQRLEHPRVGHLQSNDERMDREVGRLLDAAPDWMSYCGVIDSRSAFKGEADVLVCSGGVGRLVLQTCGSVAGILNQTPSPQVPMDSPRPLLGFDGICIVVPGERGLDEALTLALRMEQVDLTEKIAQSLETGPLLGSQAEHGH